MVISVQVASLSSNRFVMVIYWTHLYEHPISFQHYLGTLESEKILCKYVYIFILIIFFNIKYLDMSLKFVVHLTNLNKHYFLMIINLSINLNYNKYFKSI